MFDLDKWQEIFHALKKNKLRSLLTAFGVFWGVFMLILMQGSGNGLRNAVLDDFGSFATNSAFLWTQNTTLPYKGFPRGRWWNYNNEDITALRTIPEIKFIAPRINGWSADGNNVVRGINTGSFSVNGHIPEFFKIDSHKLTKGRLLNEIDIKEYRKVAVIGTRVVEMLFEPHEDPIGEYIRIKGVYFQVVGIFEPEGSNQQRNMERAQSIYLPFSTLQRTYNFGNMVHFFSITVDDDTDVEEVQKKCITLLKARHSIHPDDDRAIGYFNLQREYNQITGLFGGIKILIWIVGTGSLLAGVIGVSNIMLIVVKERTKEIGIQRAIGAPPRRIVMQIISESVFLTSLAGYLGLVLSVAIIEFISAQIGEGSGDVMFKNPEVDFQMAITSIIILVFFGALAGFIPAKRAISIKPIDALRAE